jgi:prepilin-type N-terminal cleavage/methylation domain-containing protein
VRQRLEALRKQEGGFTLTELLIVIVILGVLAGIVVFSVQFVTDRGRKTACATDKKTAETAIEAYYAANAAYPPNTAALTSGTTIFLKSWPTSTDYTITYTFVAGPPATYTLTGSIC